MKAKPSEFGPFFMLGRKLGFDPVKRKWTVHKLVGPGGVSPTLDEVIDLDPKMTFGWSGEPLGLTKLREGIINAQQYDLDPENILVTSGTQHSEFLTTMVTVDSGDEIIMDIPSWMKHQQLGETIGATVKLLHRKEELNWNFSIEELNELTSSKTKQIFICAPNNPTGAVLQEKEMRAICEIAEDCGAYVLSDEIYRGLEYEGGISPYAAHYYEKAVSMNSVSKSLAMDGIKIGWIASQDKDLIKECGTFKALETLEANCYLAEVIVAAAFEPDTYTKIIERSLNLGRTNRKVVGDWIAKHDEWSWVPPKAGYLSFPHYNFNIKSWDLCITLIKEPYRTYLFPGSLYGFENYLRLGWGGTATEEVKAGLEQVEKFMETLN